MNRTAIGKTILNLYSNLEYICDKIDSEVNSTTNIMLKSTNSYFGTVLNMYNAISNVIYRKSKLVNLKIYLEQALSAMPTDLASLLYLRYKDKFSAKQIAAFTGINIRAIEHKISYSTKVFSNNLIHVGLTDEKFLEIMNNENWIKKIYFYFCGLCKEKETTTCEIKISNGIITENCINRLTNKEYRCFKI